MTRKEMLRFFILRTIGNFLVLFAIFGILATFGPAIYYEVAFHIVEARGVHYVVSQTPQLPITQAQTTQLSGGTASFADVLAGPQEQVLVPKDPNFSIIIPKIGASAKVFPNVDISNQNVFLPILMQGVAHAAGTVFPGMNGNVYLFAHSTDNFWDVGRYNAVFYLLKDLNKGDEVVIFYQNKRYNYIVTGSKIVSPSDVSYLVNSQNQDKQQLILQTCWPPGTTLQRLLVFAQPK
ncbi:MAG: sortase [Candidatus Levyibacteriota bacterium]|jgi:sortase A